MDSISNFDVNRTEVSSIIEITPPRKINFKEELIFYFFNSMLDIVIDTWDGLAEVEAIDSIPSGQNICQSTEFICSAGVDEESAEPEYELRDENFSFIRSSEEIDTYQKRRYDQKKPKKSTGGKKTKKSGRKTIGADDIPLNAFKEQEIANVNDIAWIIEPVEENVIIKFKNGNIYEGSVYKKRMHGFGKFTWTDGTIYTGTFSNGEMTGEGTLILNDLSVYEGGVLRGYRHGEGYMTISRSHSVYRGSWQVGKKHGRGWQNFYVQNDWYDGQWENDFMEGAGVRQYPSGARYHGKFRESRRNGRGVAIMRNNDYYSGDWHKGKRKGCGEYIWNTFYNKLFCVPIQTSYIGSWDHNTRDGLGLINFGLESGARYAGFFQNNLKHGAGVLICENGATYESNQLFSKDKPIHFKPNGSCFSLSSMTNSDGQSSSSSGDLRKSSMSLVERQTSGFKLITKQILFPNIHMEEGVKATVDVCKIAFPTFQEKYSSMCLPINTPSEHIVLNYYLKKVVLYYSNNSTEQLNLFSQLKDKVKHHCCPSSTGKRSPERYSTKDKSFSSVNKDQIEHEEKNLRKAITMHLPRLRAIYKQYTRVGCLKDVPFPTLLTRLFLWQLYRDCKLLEKGLSFRKIDQLMGDNYDTELETLHNPFETIYFWQFLHSIIVISLHLYAEDCAIYAQGEGILKMAFEKFLDEDVYPNYGHHIGCMLFDYKDVLSLKKAYKKWFEQIKDPCTVLKFLLLSCTIKKCDPPTYYQKTHLSENILLQLGVNAYALGHAVTYLHDELPNFQTEPVVESLKMTDNEPFKSLYFLRKLGAKTVLSIIVKLCPNVKEGKDIINMNYEMTFYEFYESVLLCTQELVTREKEAQLKQKLECRKSSLTVDNISSSNIKGRKRSKRGTKRKITIVNA